MRWKRNYDCNSNTYFEFEYFFLKLINWLIFYSFPYMFMFSDFLLCISEIFKMNMVLKNVLWFQNEQFSFMCFCNFQNEYGSKNEVSKKCSVIFKSNSFSFMCFCKFQNEYGSKNMRYLKKRFSKNEHSIWIVFLRHLCGLINHAS